MENRKKMKKQKKKTSLKISKESQEKEINKTLSEIKKSKKYKSIADDIILNEIKSYIKKNPKVNLSSKVAIKEIKANLHRLYASFQTGKKKKRKKYLDELYAALIEKNTDKLNELKEKLLSITVSTTERKNDYKNIYNMIFNIAEIPDTIVDLGSGLNVLSFPDMDLNELTYYSYDIDSEDINFLNDYYKIMDPYGLHGTATLMDVKDPKLLKKLPISDIVFMFKLIDLIDDKSKNKKSEKASQKIIKDLLKNNLTKYIIASFATKTLTRKKMNLPNRPGFEKFLTTNNFSFKSFSTDNEIFYVIFQK